MTYNEALVYAGLLAGMAGMSTITISHYFNESLCNSNKVRAAVCNLIYKKSLRLSQTALHDTSPGKVINLLSNDVNRFESVSMFVHAIWAAPLYTTIAMYFLWQEIRWAAIAGLIIVFSVMPAQSELKKWNPILNLN